ncbi:eukaryotic translation initiation factor 4 gamma 2 [Anaeramoeba ignava]|uniref:Eukaryotic translation initiation factor 4 gamma 2 n=1 Tax=Anaeramoeba ignava TaxID=1746090 RepID=A0A9Q0LEG5_ANAIG|nr:eukaryotic translation initiation factor 4 gamma 2 [Anaeramoeba ignava]
MNNQNLSEETHDLIRYDKEFLLSLKNLRGDAPKKLKQNKIFDFIKQDIKPKGVWTPFFLQKKEKEKEKEIQIEKEKEKEKEIQIEKEIEKEKEIQIENPKFDEAINELREFLNKITAQNYQTILEKSYQKIIEFGKTENLNEKFSEMICDKAAKETIYGFIYAKYIVELSSKINSFFPEFGNLKKQILFLCRKNFKEFLEVDSNLSIQYKEQYLGNVKLIGNLYSASGLKGGIIIKCLDQLSSKTDDIHIDAFAILLEISGGKLQKEYNEKLQGFLTKCSQLKQNKNLSSKIRFKLMDILDLSKKSWESKEILQPIIVKKQPNQSLQIIEKSVSNFIFGNPNDYSTLSKMREIFSQKKMKKTIVQKLFEMVHKVNATNFDPIIKAFQILREKSIIQISDFDKFLEPFIPVCKTHLYNSINKNTLFALDDEKIRAITFIFPEILEQPITQIIQEFDDYNLILKCISACYDIFDKPIFTKMIARIFLRICLKRIQPQNKIEEIPTENNINLINNSNKTNRSNFHTDSQEIPILPPNFDLRNAIFPYQNCKIKYVLQYCIFDENHQLIFIQEIFDLFKNHFSNEKDLLNNLFLILMHENLIYGSVLQQFINQEDYKSFMNEIEKKEREN